MVVLASRRSILKLIRLIVAGGREFNNYSLLKNKLDFYLQNTDNKDIEIVSGKARGADSLGERYAKENNIKIVEFPADWDSHGKSAGHIRNTQMREYSTHLVAFWDGKSKGTANMIQIAKKANLVVVVVRY